MCPGDLGLWPAHTAWRTCEAENRGGAIQTTVTSKIFLLAPQLKGTGKSTSS